MKENNFNKEDVLVSIIMPSYNSAKTIRETIESVLSQTYRNWEMLIINDCSTDNSVDIIREYCGKDSRIRMFNTEVQSGAPSLARNIGIENARGKYIAFLDSDDVWLPERLQNQVAFQESNNYDIVYSYYKKMSYDGVRSSRVIKFIPEVAYEQMLQVSQVSFLTAIFRRSVIGDVRFKTIQQEDYCFTLDVMKKGVVAHLYAEVTAFYRISKGSRSSNKFKMIGPHWDILRKHQNISFIASCYYMVTYFIFGFLKYIK